MIEENRKLRDEISCKRKVIDDYYKEKNGYQCKIREMQSHMDCLKAAMIIKKTVVGKNGFGQEREYKAYDESDLKQIAKHLLVYCNHVAAI